MTEKTRNILFYAVAVLATGFGVHLTQEYRFYNIAVNDLFLYDPDHIWDGFCSAGGLATLMASFLTQFMNIPFVGTVIVTVLYALTSWLLALILKRQADLPLMKGLAFLPVVWLFLCLDNDYYRFQGHCAYLMALAALYLYVSIPLQWKKYRYLLGIVLVPVLYHLAGSAAVIFTICTVRL